MDLRRLGRRTHATPLRLLGCAALVVVVVACTLVRLAMSRGEPQDGIPQGPRALWLPTLPDEPSTEEIMGPSVEESTAFAASGTEEAQEMKHQPDLGRSQTATPWYGLCPPQAVASLDDFRLAVLRSPQLAAYYSDFQWAQARLVKTEASRWVYVSYQKAGTIVRTKRPKLLPKGDPILTDGIRQARAYCCNEIFEVVEVPLLHSTPAEIVDAPPPPPALGSEVSQPALGLPPVEQSNWPPGALLPPSQPGTAPPDAASVPPGSSFPPFPPRGVVVPPTLATLPPLSPPAGTPQVSESSPPLVPFLPADSFLPPLDETTPEVTFLPPVDAFLPPSPVGEIPPGAEFPPLLAVVSPPGEGGPPSETPGPTLPPPIGAALPPSPVPEPSTWTLLGLGCLGLVGWRWSAGRRVQRGAAEGTAPCKGTGITAG